MDAERIAVEVAAAWPDRQYLVALELPSGSTVADAVAASGLDERLPELVVRDDHLGIFGELCGPERVLRDGDRVELYRPLTLDPKTIRRINAERQKRDR